MFMKFEKNCWNLYDRQAQKLYTPEDWKQFMNGYGYHLGSYYNNSFPFEIRHMNKYRDISDVDKEVALTVLYYEWQLDKMTQAVNEFCADIWNIIFEYASIQITTFGIVIKPPQDVYILLSRVCKKFYEILSKKVITLDESYRCNKCGWLNLYSIANRKKCIKCMINDKNCDENVLQTCMPTCPTIMFRL